jgi:hypothetical protein
MGLSAAAVVAVACIEHIVPMPLGVVKGAAVVVGSSGTWTRRRGSTRCSTTASLTSSTSSLGAEVEGGDSDCHWMYCMFVSFGYYWLRSVYFVF